MRANLPLEVVFSVRLVTWHQLFAARGYPPGLSPSAGSHDDVAAALSSADLPLALARAVFVVAVFASEAGRIDLYNAADALGYPHRWPEAESPADLVAMLLAASASDDAVAELLEAAQALRDRSFRRWSTFVYAGSRTAAAGPAGDPAYECRRSSRRVSAAEQSSQTKWRAAAGAVVCFDVADASERTTAVKRSFASPDARRLADEPQSGCIPEATGQVAPGVREAPRDSPRQWAE